MLKEYSLEQKYSENYWSELVIRTKWGPLGMTPTLGGPTWGDPSLGGVPGFPWYSHLGVLGVALPWEGSCVPMRHSVLQNEKKCATMCLNGVYGVSK